MPGPVGDSVLWGARSLPLRNLQSRREAEMHSSEKFNVNLSEASGTRKRATAPCASEDSGGGALAGRDCIEQGGQAREDFLKSCWRRGAVSQRAA